MTLKRKHLGQAGLLTLILALAVQCSGPGVREPEFYDQAEKAIQSGKGDEVAAQILENSAEIPPGQRKAAIGLLDKLGPTKGRDALMKLYNTPGFTGKEEKEAIIAQLLKRNDSLTADFLRRRIEQEPELYNSVVGRYMIQQGDAKSAQFLASMAEKDRSILSGEIAQFFGSQKLAESVPLLKYMTENSVDPAAAFDALTRIKEGGAAEYVVQAAADPKHPSRLYAIRYLPQLQNNELTVPVLRSIVLNYRSENTEILHQAMESLGETEYSDESYRALKRVFYGVESTETQAAAIVAMARMRDMDPQALLEELKKEAKEEVTRKPEPAVTHVTRPHTEQKKTTKPTRTRIRPGSYSKLPYTKAQSQQYVRLLSQIMGESMGVSQAKNTLGQMHNSFLSYSDSDTETATFFRRSIGRYYNVPEEKATELMKEGINVPGSVNAILKNAKAEYGSESMQVYAVSRFFAIPRWQSQILIDLYNSGAMGH